MTPVEKKRFDKLATAIRRICSYQTPRQLQREYGGLDSGIDYLEALEYAYDNMRNEARAVAALVRPKKRSGSAPSVPAVESAVENGQG